MPSERASGRRGFTLVELVVALAIGSLLLLALTEVMGTAVRARAEAEEHAALAREARFALQRMVLAVRRSPGLVLPGPDSPLTAQQESVRDALAVLMDPTRDDDDDGFPDVDNDRDGRIDEDPPADLNNDGGAGILGADDDGDGDVDETSAQDDDEDQDDAGGTDEELFDGLDQDGDAAIDEDLAADVSGDGQSGLAGVDDDGDGATDEGSAEDDDEDEDTTGNKDEDWLDTIAFVRQGSQLIERYPLPHPAGSPYYAEEVIAEGVTDLRVERLERGPNDRFALVELKIELTGASGRSVVLTSRVRVGAER